jgi:hypothetical protein
MKKILLTGFIILFNIAEILAQINTNYRPKSLFLAIEFFSEIPDLLKILLAFIIGALIACIFYWKTIKRIFNLINCPNCNKIIKNKIISSKKIREFKENVMESYIVDSDEYEIIEKNNKKIIRPRKETKYRTDEVTMYEIINTYHCIYCKNNFTQQIIHRKNIADLNAEMENYNERLEAYIKKCEEDAKWWKARGMKPPIDCESMKKHRHKI